MKRALGILITLTLTLALGLSWAQTISDDVQFTRQPSVNAQDHSAEISWATNNEAATYVKYGTDKNNLDKESRHSGGARDHRVVLSELQPGTTYFYQILTNDGKVRHEGQFTTKGTQAASASGSTSGTTASGAASDDVRIVEGPTASVATGNSVELRWRTNNVAATDVKYGTDQNNPDQRAYTAGGAREHTARLDNLQSGQTYFFQILTRDGQVRHQGSFTFQPNQTAQIQSQPVTTTTTAQTGTTSQPSNTGVLGTIRDAVQGRNAAGVNITNGPVVEYVDDNRAIIVWKTDNNSSSTIRYGNDARSMNQTATGSWGDRHRVEISGLQPNTTYFFQVESATQQAAGNAARQQSSFRTVAPGATARRNSVPF
jgi:phosphodiesterase/alkaline phosphatase D-like protein